MSSTAAHAPAASSVDSQDSANARTLPTAEELSQALQVDVLDREGKKTPLGELVKGKRTVIVFVRHFWCLNCQAYLRSMSTSIPPAKLPPDTQIIVIGCGSYQPIDTYAQKSSSLYPIYTDPTRRLHSIFKFKSNLAEGPGGDQQRDYMRNAGSSVARFWGGVWAALGNVSHANYVGPKALNGGEVILSANGQCEYINRMQNTTDHTNISELAVLIGAPHSPCDNTSSSTHISS